MKNLIGILTVAMVFIFAGIQDVSAQSNWEVKVDWADYCGGCPTAGGYEYYVCCTITDICEPQVVYNDCKIKPSGVYTHTFSVGEICDVDQEEACFIVEVSVIKRCIIGQYEICSNSDHKTVNCETIYGGEMEFGLSRFTNSDANVEILNINGKFITSYKLKGAKDQQIIDTRRFENGIYILNIKNYGKIVGSDKITIIR